MVQDLVSHKRHRDSLGQMFFNPFEDLIGVPNGFKGQDMTVCCDDLPVIFQEVPEAVFPPGASLFNDLEIAALMNFFIIKVDPIQCFQNAASCAEKLICTRHRPQTHLAALFANDAVPIPIGGRKVGLIIKLPHSIGKLFLDFVKPFRQAATSHLFVKELKRAQEDELVLKLELFQFLLVFPVNILGPDLGKFCQQRQVCLQVLVQQQKPWSSGFGESAAAASTMFISHVLFVQLRAYIEVKALSSVVQIGFGDCGEKVDLFLKLFFYFLAKLFFEFLNVWPLCLCGRLLCNSLNARAYCSFEFVILLHFACDDAKLNITDLFVSKSLGRPVR